MDRKYTVMGCVATALCVAPWVINVCVQKHQFVRMEKAAIPPDPTMDFSEQVPYEVPDSVMMPALKKHATPVYGETEWLCHKKDGFKLAHTEIVAWLVPQHDMDEMRASLKYVPEF